MILQLALGTVMMTLTLLAIGVGFWAIELWLARSRDWLVRPPHRPRLLAALGVLGAWVIAEMTVAVWAWALLFLALGLFDHVEPAVYFALVVFTTLGFGDIILGHDEWRLLSGLAAANGLLSFGVMTALLVEGVRGIRVDQMAADEARR
ncbi:potassium channel family protein [Wenxinia marina]|uniref:Ion channel n=1 Tax=Wenxinia marina DSM 24838 TaxID=1123501 RepID=A0A0D0QIF3_9RHOB|nr:potassium channel family protein [Wenxinia marina]KIQ70833.1 Ion channel [Wenxinia marina DSM 24838]GGL56947.1 hypothetical protein GCM10011392_09260 [Wenxinia marina]